MRRTPSIESREPMPPEPRRRRRAVGPPGARPAVDEPRLEPVEQPSRPEDDERFRAERPPHHDQER